MPEASPARRGSRYRVASSKLEVAHALADDPARPARRHRDAVEHVGRFHRALLVRHDEQLGLVAELVHEIEEPVQVHVVERGLDLVHQVEGRRAGAEHGEEIRERGQRALAARQQREPADDLPRRPRLDLDARVQQIVRVGEHEAARPAGEQHCEQLGEVARHVGERGVEDADDLLVDRLDHARELAPRVAHVVELLLQELVPFDAAPRTPTSASGLTGPISRSSRSSSRARAGQRDAVGDLGHPARRSRRRARSRTRGARSRPPARAGAGSRLPRSRAGRRARAARRAAARPRAVRRATRRASTPGRARGFGLLAAPACAGARPALRLRRRARAGGRRWSSIASRRARAAPRRARARASSSGRAARRASTSASRAVSPVRRSSTAAPPELELAGAATRPGRAACSTSARLAASSLGCVLGAARFVERGLGASARRAASRLGVACAVRPSSSPTRAASVARRSSQRRGPHLDLAPQLRRPGASARSSSTAAAPVVVRWRAARRAVPRRAAAARGSTGFAAALARVSASSARCSTASASAAGVTADDAGGPGAPRARAAEAIASRVTAITSPDSRARRRARLPSAVDEHERREQPREHAVERRRADRGRTTPSGCASRRRERDLHAGRATRRRRAERRRVAALQLLDRGARRVRRRRRRPPASASPSAAATATSAPASISSGRRAGRARRRARRSSPPAAGVRSSSASASVSARARRARRSAVGLRATRRRPRRRASSAARSSRASVGQLRRRSADARLDLGTQPLGRALERRRRPRARARSSRARRRRGELAPAPRELALDGAGTRVGVLGVRGGRRPARPPRRHGRRRPAPRRWRAGVVRGAHSAALAASASAVRAPASATSASTAASCSRVRAASATSVSTTPSSATAASSRSSPRRRSVDEVRRDRGCARATPRCARADRRRRRRRAPPARARRRGLRRRARGSRTRTSCSCPRGRGRARRALLLALRSRSMSRPARCSRIARSSATRPSWRRAPRRPGARAGAAGGAPRGGGR